MDKHTNELYKQDKFKQYSIYNLDAIRSVLER